MAAAPGARELVTIGQVWELAQGERWDRSRSGYDLVIVDAPASGHGLGMLRTPRTFGDIARVGPIRRQADRIHEFLTDPNRIGYLAVALPEEMPVNETLEFETRLHEQLGMPLDAIVRQRPLPAALYGTRRPGSSRRPRTTAWRRRCAPRSWPRSPSTTAPRPSARSSGDCDARRWRTS